MAGKHVYSAAVKNYEYNPRTARAWCEGMAYRAGGTLLGRPITDQPYAAPHLDELTAWAAGWTHADGFAPAGVLDPLNCAIVAAVVVDT